MVGGQQPRALAHHDHHAPLLRPGCHRPPFELAVDRLPPPRQGRAGIAACNQPRAIGGEIEHDFRSIRAKVVRYGEIAEPAAIERATRTRALPVGCAAFPWLAMRTPQARRLVQFMDSQKLAAQRARPALSGLGKGIESGFIHQRQLQPNFAPPGFIPAIVTRA